MADARVDRTPGGAVQPRRADRLGVFMSLAFIAVASLGITGNPWIVFNSAVRWGVAGAVLLIGLLLMLSALPRRSRR